MGTGRWLAAALLLAVASSGCTRGEDHAAVAAVPEAAVAEPAMPVGPPPMEPAGDPIELGEVARPDGQVLTYVGFRTTGGGICIDWGAATTCAEAGPPLRGMHRGSGGGGGSDGAFCAASVGGRDVVRAELTRPDGEVIELEPLPGSPRLGASVFGYCFEGAPHQASLIGFDADGNVAPEPTRDAG